MFKNNYLMISCYLVELDFFPSDLFFFRITNHKFELPQTCLNFLEQNKLRFKNLYTLTLY